MKEANPFSSNVTFSYCPPCVSEVCALQWHSRGTDGCYDGLYPGHIHTTPVQKALLAVGSGVAALQNPYRHGERHKRLFDKYSVACNGTCNNNDKICYILLFMVSDRYIHEFITMPKPPVY